MKTVKFIYHRKHDNAEVHCLYGEISCNMHCCIKESLINAQSFWIGELESDNEEDFTSIGPVLNIIRSIHDSVLQLLRADYIVLNIDNLLCGDLHELKKIILEEREDADSLAVVSHIDSIDTGDRHE